jgi:hypothetical protein
MTLVSVVVLLLSRDGGIGRIDGLGLPAALVGHTSWIAG